MIVMSIRKWRILIKDWGIITQRFCLKFYIFVYNVERNLPFLIPLSKEMITALYLYYRYVEYSLFVFVLNVICFYVDCSIFAFALNISLHDIKIHR